MTPTPLADAITDRIVRTFALWHQGKVYDSDVKEVLVIEQTNIQSLERKALEAREALETIIGRAYTPQPCAGWSDEMQAAIHNARIILSKPLS